MGNYVASYFRTHLKHWYIHVVSILAMVFALFFTLLIGRYFDAKLGDLQMVRFLCSILFAIISSAILIFPNYIVAKNYSKTLINIIVLLIFNQFVSTLPYYLIGYIIYFSK